MTMMMMANHAEPLDSSCTNTKYMSWVWRNGLRGAEGTQWLHITKMGEIEILCFLIRVGKLVCLKVKITFELHSYQN